MILNTGTTADKVFDLKTERDYENMEDHVIQVLKKFRGSVSLVEAWTRCERLEELNEIPQFQILTELKKVTEIFNQQVHKEAAIHCPVPIEKIKKGVPIVFKGTIGEHPATFFVSTKYWNQLQITPKETLAGAFQLLDHLPDLLPRRENHIGLITFQNGINNSLDDFTAMGNSILKRIPEGTLLVGLYNPTKGLFTDLGGVFSKLRGILDAITASTYHWMLKISTLLLESNTQWLHVAHSEGGLLAKRALQMIEMKNQGEIPPFFRTNFIATNLGAFLPIPIRHAKTAFNIYSEEDKATLPRVQAFLKEIKEGAKGYEIKPVERITRSILRWKPLNKKMSFEEFKRLPLSERSEYERSLLAYLGGLSYLLGETGRRHAPAFLETVKGIGYEMVAGDHAFTDDTYQVALSNNFDIIRDKIGKFYGGENP